ncbi:MAG: HlyD family efflux transporter periplasmic adaptor subunit [Saprospiraceae bacterium]
MKKSILYIVMALVIALAGYYLLRPKSEDTKSEIYAKIMKENFLVTVNATGELKAKKSTKIRGPQGMRSAGIYQTTIKELIPEGTIVKQGDFVASLDKTELATKITQVETEIERENTKLEQIKIDTAIQMKGVRNEIANLRFSMAQEKLEIEKNKYEPQMVIDQSKLKLEMTLRSLDQLENKVELLVIQSNAKVREIQANLKQFDSKYNQMMSLAGSFSIKAPEDGMLIYEKGWDGKKGPGSQISAWDPVVAELPDLTKMTSVAYVNEVDISKIKKGQFVEIKVDAFPEKVFDGQIISVANIGQELRGQEAKVFEVVIGVNQIDDILRPAMTTSNQIKIYEYANVMHIPLEGFYSDSIDYVIVKTGAKFEKHQIIRGVSNEDNIIVVAGLSGEEQIVLTTPEDMSTLNQKLLSKEVIESAQKEKETWMEEKDKYDDKNAEAVVSQKDQNKSFGGGGRVIIF